MKKLIIALGCLSLWSCSDVELQEDSKSTSRTTNLNLMPFSNTGIVYDHDDTGGVNRLWIQGQIDLAKAQGYDGLEIGELDCYLNVAGVNGAGLPNALRIPSDFALVMSDDTHLRISPAGTESGGYSLILIGRLNDNINDGDPDYPHDILITGGHLYGDRREHPSTTLQGHVVRIFTSFDIDIDNVEISDSNADGICISGSEINVPAAVSYTQPERINITNCTIRSSRRCNLTITDGSQMDIGNNFFYDAGMTVTKTSGQLSLGANPRCAMNIEGDREWQGSTLHYFSHPQFINVHDNFEEGSFAHSFYVGLGSYITLQDNESERCVGYTYGDNIQVLNNTIEGNGTGFGLAGGSPGFTTTVHDNLFEGNTVSNVSIGIVIYSSDTVINNNDFDNCGTGVQFLSVKDVSITNNAFTSTLLGSKGIVQENSPSHTDYYFADNLNIQGNVLNFLASGINAHSIFINGTNSLPAYSGYTVNITDNAIYSGGKFQLAGVNGFHISGNAIRADMGTWVINCSGIVRFIENDLIADPRLNAPIVYPTHTVPTHKMSTVYVSGCNSNELLFKNNEMSNLSTDNDTHIMQITGSSEMYVIGNTMTQQVSKIVDVVAPSASVSASTNLNFIDNLGNIGTCSVSPFLIYAPNCAGIVAMGNVASSTPTVRQNINGVGPWGCP